MRKLKLNESLIAEYKNYLLIEVMCPRGQSYRTTIDKFEPIDAKTAFKNNKNTYYKSGNAKRGFYHEF